MAILSYGQVGWRAAAVVNPSQASSLWTSIFGVWNADTLGTSLDTSIYGVYNGDNVNDSSGNALNGTNVGGVTFTTGKIGNAFTFNGSNYIQLPNSSNQFNFTTDFSFSFWVYIPSISTATNGILANYTNQTGSKGFIAYLKSDGKFEMYIVGTNGSSTATSTTQIPTGWTNIVVTRKMIAPKETMIYINGVFNAQSGVNNTVTLDYHTTTNPSIGAIDSISGGVQDLFGRMMNNSKIDGLTIWNRVLTANEVTSLYNSGNGAEYPFSSQTLDSLNDAVGSNNGTRPASTLTGGVPGPSFTAGKIGKAFNFDGINDYISLPNDGFKPSGEFSISTFINVSTIGAVRTILISCPNTSNGFRLYVGSNGKIYFEYNSSYFISSSVLSASTWYHIVALYDGANYKIYINGNLENTKAGVAPNWGGAGTNELSIGKYSNSAYYFLGKIDALNLWDKELTSTEITELYNSGNGKQYPN